MKLSKQWRGQYEFTVALNRMVTARRMYVTHARCREVFSGFKAKWMIHWEVSQLKVCCAEQDSARKRGKDDGKGIEQAEPERTPGDTFGAE